MTARGSAPARCADVGDHAAVLGEVVRAVEQVVLARVDVLDRDVDARELAAHRAARLDAAAPAAVGVPAPGLVDLGQVGVVAPVLTSTSCRMPVPYVPGRPPKMRAVAAFQSPASSSTSASTCLRTKFCSSGSSSPATSVTASSSTSTRCGKASRKKPEMRTVTSIRGRPSSSSGITSRPTIRRVSGCHSAARRAARGSRPRRRRRCASRPCPRRRCRPSPAARRGRPSSASASLRAGLVGEVGRQRARVDAVHVAAGREHVQPPARGGAGRPASTWRPCRPPISAGISSAVAQQLRHDLVLAPAPARASIAGSPVFGAVGQERAEDLASWRVVTSGAASAKPCRPQDRVQQAAELLALRHLAEDVQPVADLQVLDLAQVAVDVLDQVAEVLELGLVALDARGRGAARPSCSSVQMRFASVGSFGGVERLGARVLVEQLLELGELVVGLRAHHRRHEVVDHDGVGAALGLHALAGVVDDERVEERHVAEAGVGRAGLGQPERLARQPLERAVLAEVDDRVGASRVSQR